MKMNRREMIFLGLTAALLIGAWLLVFRPRRERMDHMESQIMEKKRILEEIATSRPRAIRNLKNDIRELEQIVAEQRSRLPRGEKIEKVFQDLSGLARANDLRIHQIKTSQTSDPSNPAEKEQKETDIEEQGFLLELEGDFTGVQGFLESLEKQPRIVRVDEIRIQRVSPKSGDATVHANLRLRVFSRKGIPTS